MTGYFVSLDELVVGVVHACAQVRSPGPLLIARVDLLGEQAVGLAKHHRVPTLL